MAYRGIIARFLPHMLLVACTYSFAPLACFERLLPSTRVYISDTSVEDISAPVEDHKYITKKVLPTFRIPFEISPLKPYGPMITSISAARDEIISLLDIGVVDPPDHFRLDYLIQCLETSYTPIQTTSFFNFATEGKWQLLYSNVLTPRALQHLEFSVSQAISSTGARGNVENAIHWRLLDSSSPELETSYYRGDLIVKCSFDLNSQGNMILMLDEHVLTPEGPVPDDVEGLIMSLQRSVPFESFDPNESVQQITYLDTELRIMRISDGGASGRFANIKNVFVREVV